MASVSTDKTGLRRILFTWNGSRRTLYVGRLTNELTRIEAEIPKRGD